MLSHISGIKKTVAKNIVDYRKEMVTLKIDRNFKSKRCWAKILRTNGRFPSYTWWDNIFDNTGIHPESYHIAEKILRELNLDIATYEADRKSARALLSKFKYEKFAKDNDFV